MKLIIDQAQREAKRRAHTATHLLHASLSHYFPNTKQAGSLVDSDLLRFDFYAESLLTPAQIEEIETTINQEIYEALPVTTIETTFDEAKSLWAKAFFEEKYGDKVRLVRVFRGEEVISAELCGGTHVSNTKEIWAFSILSQEAVASGIKRITAITWPKVIEKIHEQNTILEKQVEIFQIKSIAQIEEKTIKFFKDYQDLSAKVEKLSQKLLKQQLLSGKEKHNADFTYILSLESGSDFKLLWTIAKEVLEIKTALFFTNEGNYLILTNGEISAKDLAKKYDLKGGGSDMMVQGRDEKVLQIS